MENQENIVEKVSEALKSAEILPIPVQTVTENDSVKYFAGTFQEFIDAAKSLGAESVFVEPIYLEEDDFFYDAGLDEEDSCCDCCNCKCDCKCECDCECENHDCEKEDKCCCKEDSSCECDCEEDSEIYPEDLDGLDLSLIEPEISEYEKYIGSECGVTLRVPGADGLELEIFTEWFDKFADLVESVSEKIEFETESVLKIIEEKAKSESEED